MKILQVNFSDASGGASRACYRLFRAFRDAGNDARLFVVDKTTNDPNVVGRSGIVRRVRQQVGSMLESRLMRTQHSTDLAFRSLALLPSGLGAAIDATDAQVVNLHWINDGALSIGEIGALRKPVVWTLHDTWAFCGAEHYPLDGSTRPADGYLPGNRVAGQSGRDIDRWTWERKRRAWRRPMTIVSPSGWLARCAQSSALMRDWDVRVVPNPLNTEVYRPLDKTFCRQALKLPLDRPVIAFGGLGAASDPRKGFHLLIDALRHVAANWTGPVKPLCVVFGQTTPVDAPDVGLELFWAGSLKDDLSLVIHYNAADVVVVPSLQENLAQAATESQACGVPAVAFDACGMPDAIEHGVSGMLARAYDPIELGRCISQVLTDDALRARLADGARQRALREWAPAVIIPKYLKVFEDAARRAT